MAIMDNYYYTFNDFSLPYHFVCVYLGSYLSAMAIKVSRGWCRRRWQEQH